MGRRGARLALARSLYLSRKQVHRLNRARRETNQWPPLGHQRITSLVVRSATRSRTYTTRYVVGRLRRYPEPVVAILSKRARRDTHPAYFLCSDTALSVRTILKYYGDRWHAEVDNWHLKERFGVADYRVQSYEAILRWHAAGSPMRGSWPT